VSGAVTLTLLVVQPTSLCNFNCTYCYVPGRHDSTRIADETLYTLFDKLFKSSLVGNDLEILWHAGEPLTAGLSFFERAVGMAKDLCPPGLRITHTVQTNGSLINRAWGEFFLEHGFGVGISLDGPAWLHDRVRVDWGGRGTWDASIRGYDLLRSMGMEPGILCVLGAESLRHPERMFRFFLDLECRWVGFNVEEVENANLQSSLNALPPATMEERYRNFITRFFDLWQKHERPFAVREFDDILRIIQYAHGGQEHFRSPDETLGLVILTVQKNGDLSTYSPEFAGGISPDHNHFVIGNVHTSDFNNLDDSPVYQKIRQEVIAGIKNCAATCPWFMFCGGAYTSNKFFENGDLTSTETTACRLHRQVLADALLTRLVADSVSRGPGGDRDAGGLGTVLRPLISRVSSRVP
jgi:uncharacterized protein